MCTIQSDVQPKKDHINLLLTFEIINVVNLKQFAMEKNRAFSLVNQNQSTYVVDTKHDTKEMHLAFLWALRYLMEDNQHNTNNPFFEKVVNVVGWMKRRGSFGDLSRCASRAFDAYYSYEHGDYKYDWDEG